jgi:hypothetical protein
MKRTLLASVLALMLFGAGCGDDDYSYRTENCTSIDYGGGDEYELCCRLRCHGECDYDECHESCDEEFSCESSTGDPCPPDVIEDYGYPHCIY